MAKCKTCGAPVNLAPDGDPKYQPPRSYRRAYLDQCEEIERLREAVEKMLDAIKTGNIDSPEIDLGDPDIPPFRFHEEWAHHARKALGDTDNG